MKRATAIPWCKDETDIKVKGTWRYLCRAVDQVGKALGFTLSEHRDTAATRRFILRAIDANGAPEQGVIDNGGTNFAGL